MKLNQDLPDIFEEFESWRQEGFLEAKKNKEDGKPLIGVYCTFFPTEIPMALEIKTVSLCAFSNETIAAGAEAVGNILLEAYRSLDCEETSK